MLRQTSKIRIDKIFRNTIHKSVLRAEKQVVVSLTNVVLLLLTKLFFFLVPVIKIEINSTQFYVLPHSYSTKMIVSNTEHKCIPVSMTDYALEFIFVKYASRSSINFAWMLQQALFSVLQ